MFDIGFTELLAIGVIALVVLGPERLPKLARTAGLLLGRAQRYVADVKTEINREIRLDELKQLQTSVADSARELEASMRQGIASVQEGATQLAQEISAVTPEEKTALPPETPPHAAVREESPATTTTGTLPLPPEAPPAEAEATPSETSTPAVAAPAIKALPGIPCDQTRPVA